MEYTNENFELFQNRLADSQLCDPFLWDLRDVIFCEAFYGRERKLLKLCSIPGGEYLYVLAEWLRALPRALCRKPSAKTGKSHFLFCSPRNNHINRIYPLFKERNSNTSCAGWVSTRDVFGHIDDADQKKFADIDGQWARFVKLRDSRTAKKYCRDLEDALPGFFSQLEIRKVNACFVMFLAWRRFWHHVMDENIEEIYCTFEKSPVAKSFFYVARKLGIPHRVHWVHGLRHASLQSTLSTELWCMTEGDVRFFNTRVPEYCVPKVKRNPEADMLVASVGVRTPEQKDAMRPVHFLFLGPGLETSYTQEMRMADLAVIKRAQDALGNEAAWRFRPHPSARERFHEELEAAGIVVSDFSSNTLIDDLKWSDAVGSSWSSLLLDVRETGRPIFWVQAEVRPLGGVNELIADGVGVHVSSTTIVDKLREIFNET